MLGIKCNALRISSRLTFDEAIRFASIRAIYVDRKPATTIYIINGRSRVISEMGNGVRQHRWWWLRVSPRRIIARVYVPVLLKRWTYRLIRRTDPDTDRRIAELSNGWINIFDATRAICRAHMYNFSLPGRKYAKLLPNSSRVHRTAEM